MAYKDVMEKFGFIPADHEKPNWFPVSINGIYDDRGRKIPGYKRVQRDDSGDTLAVHSDKYELLTYERQFQMFDRELALSGLDLTDMAIGTDLTHNGARCFRQYILPKYLIEMPNNRDLMLRIIMFGSYDGSSSFQGRAGGFDFVCANTSVVGKAIIDLKVRHTGSDMEGRIDKAVEQIVAAAKSYVDNAARLKAWCSIPVSIISAENLLKSMPQSTPMLVAQLTAEFAKSPDQSLWGLWNVLTTWSTHHGVSKNGAQVCAQREKRVTTLVEGKDWDVFEQVRMAA